MSRAPVLLMSLTLVLLVTTAYAQESKEAGHTYRTIHCPDSEVFVQVHSRIQSDKIEFYGRRFNGVKRKKHVLELAAIRSYVRGESFTLNSDSLCQLIVEMDRHDRYKLIYIRFNPIVYEFGTYGLLEFQYAKRERKRTRRE